MSWDIVLFNSSKKFKSVEEIDERQLEPIDFDSILEKNFETIIEDEDHREIKGKDFSIDYFIDDENVSNKMVSIQGENGLYALTLLAQKHNWQLFDTALGEMIDSENPTNNGYANFQNYLNQIKKGK